MLRFSKPNNLYTCLFETYVYLGNQLKFLTGYPIHLGTRSEEIDDPIERLPDGGIVYQLPTYLGASRFPFAVISPEAVKDRFCTKLMAKFVILCKRITEECKYASEIKTFIIRE